MTNDKPVTREYAAKYLRHLATHFAPSEWDYTRHHDIVDIKYKKVPRSEDKTYEPMWKRILVGIQFSTVKRNKYFRWDSGQNFRWWEKPWRFFQFQVGTVAAFARRGRTVPDGSLHGGNVISFWEEDGEYIQVVQPSVGKLVADFLREEPDNPHAQKIADEIARIVARYRSRIKDEEVE